MKYIPGHWLSPLIAKPIPQSYLVGLRLQQATKIQNNLTIFRLNSWPSTSPSHLDLSVLRVVMYTK